MNKQQLFQRLILYTIEGYLDDIKNDTTYNYPFMLKLRTAIRSYMVFHKFNREEYNEVMRIADTEFMENAKEQMVDRVIFALEMLFLYVKEIPKNKRAMLNISDSKLIQAKTGLIMDMLKMKQSRPESHTRVKEIIEDSRINAKRYFYFCQEELIHS